MYRKKRKASQHIIDLVDGLEETYYIADVLPKPKAVSYTHLGKVGISLPRTAQAQYDATQHLPLSQAKAGDLVFFHSTYNAGSYVTHVGIYVGNNKMYHAGDPIGYADLSSSYWQQHLIGAGRVKQ